MKFVKGQTYKMQYTRCTAIRRNRNGYISEHENRTITGDYEFIACRGSKFHFYNPYAGIDVLFSKAEAIAALVPDEPLIGSKAGDVITWDGRKGKVHMLFSDSEELIKIMLDEPDDSGCRLLHVRKALLLAQNNTKKI